MSTFEKIYEVVKRIPEGKVAAAFVFGGGNAQRALLENEGVVFESSGCIDLQKYGI